MAAKDVYSDRADGYRDGWEGYGCYRNGQRVDSGREPRALRRIPRRLAAGVAIAALLFAAYFVFMHWQAIVTAVFTLAGLVVVGVCLWFGGIPDIASDSPDESLVSVENGWRNGPDGVGWYVASTRIDDDDSF